MKLLELNGLKHPHILVKFLDGELGLVEEPFTDPVRIMIPTTAGQDNEYRDLPLFNLTHTGQGMCVENKFTKYSKGITL